jgi:predicted O-linked N-acetylglucosamine transferase (SPINDLY family)
VLWGHPVTTGLPSIDVFLTSAAMEPSDGEQHYSERLHRLPGLGTCYAKPDARPTALPNELAGGRPTGVLAFMPQLVQKLRPRFDRALARIASRAPELRLLMTPYFNEDPVRRHRERLGRAFAVEGVALDSRLAICRWVSQPEWLGLARIADFALDAFDWSGGNTSLEMFWFDTPIVTLPGELMRGRHTMAMLEQMELPQLIARDVDDYVRIAVELATSADFRAEMRGLVRERKHRLYDDRTVVDAFVRFCAEQAATGRERRLARDARLAP